MRLLYWTLGLLALVFVVAGTASATHFRYGTLSWEPTENPNEVRFTGGQAWRSSYFGHPAVGSIISAEGCLSTGDGSCVAFYLKVNARSAANDWFSATFVSADGTNGFTHTYPAPNNGGTPWIVEWSSCCRISPISSGNYHVNNPDQSEALATRVDLAAPANRAPVSTLPPINACPREALCTIPIPAVDGDGDTLHYRLASSAEAGDGRYVPPGPPQAPHQAQIDPDSGVLSWDTHGATVGSASVHTLYSIQLAIEDGRTKTPLDFFIEILPEGVTPPYWVMPPTPCGQTFYVSLGDTLAFDVRAASDGPTRIVYVSHLGLPSGASFPPVTPANPASGVFSWTPTASQLGSHLVVFAAEDDLGYPAPPCPVTIEVTLEDPPVFTLPTACGAPARIVGVVGLPVSFPVEAASPYPGRMVTLTLESGPAGFVFPGAGPSNPAGAFAIWPAPTEGLSHAVFRATDDIGLRARCVVPIDIQRPTGQAFSLAVWAGNAVPVAAEYRTVGHDLRGPDAPFSQRTTAIVDVPQAGLYAEGVTEWASIVPTPGGVVSTAGSEIAYVRLANGLVELHGLRQEARVAWSATGAPVVERTAQVARVVVNGQVVPVAQTPQSLIFPGGYVLLFETSNDASAQKLALADNLLHVYVRGPYGREEVILGSVILQAGLGVQPMRQTRDILVHDDLASGEDAGATRASAMLLPVGAHHGNMPPGDAVDAYLVPARHGEKIAFVAQPALGVEVAGGLARVGPGAVPVVGSPGGQVAPLEIWHATLYDPTGAMREESLVVVSGGAARVELNADLDGDWLVELWREDAGLGTNYSLALSVTPVPLLPQNDALSGADAPAACAVGDASIPLVGNGLWPGVVRDDDFADTYRITAEIGEIVAVALKPGEDADGASMALELYDRDCTLLQRRVGTFNLLKGEPTTVEQLPSTYSGDYYVRIERVNGVANHYVDVSVVNPLPTAPGNDALTGADAPAAREDAIAPPPGAFQGRLHEGDDGDAYRLDLVAGRETTIAFHMSALSGANVALYAPDGSFVPRTQAVGSTLVAWRFDATQTGGYVLVVTPGVGGGNYLVAWGQEPVAR